MVEKQDDGRLHCPYCRYSTQLANKFERHMEKKHSQELGIKSLNTGDEEE